MSGNIITLNDPTKNWIVYSANIASPTGNLYIGNSVVVSGNITANNFVGNLSGNATTATTIDITDTIGNNFDYLFTFVSAGGASQTLRADITPDPFTFNPSDGSIKKTASSSSALSLISISPINTGLVPPSIAECKLSLYGPGATEPRILGLAQVDDYNSSNFDFGGDSVGDFDIYRRSNPFGEGDFGNEFAGIKTFTNNDTGTATALLYYLQSAPYKETGIRVYNDTIQMYSGLGNNVPANIGSFSSGASSLSATDALGTATITLTSTDTDSGNLSTITINNSSITFRAGNVANDILILSTDAFFQEPIRFGTDCGVLEQSVIGANSGTTNLVFNSTNAYRTYITTPTAAGRIIVLQAPVGQQIGGWFKICNRSLTYTVAVQQPAGTTIFTIPVSPAGGAGSVAKFAIDNNGTAYFRCG